MSICLYGPSGTGKTTVGRLLAERLNMTWFDLDVEIEKEAGQSIETMFRILGEGVFRELESAKLDHLLKADPSSVISLGGGALLNNQNRLLAESYGPVVLLSAKIDTLVTRLTTDSVVRPLVKDDPRQRLTDLLARRREHYASFGKPVSTDNLTAAEIVREIQIRIGQFQVQGMDKTYDILVQPGLLNLLGKSLLVRGIHGPAALVCDQNVDPLYADRALESLKTAGIETMKIVIPAGEEHKSIQTVAAIWEGFLSAGVERGSVVIALGGGVTGDLTGFAAATYLRGVPWVNVPTSLLAMVDSSLGGKTGADLPQGKNLIGVFHAPLLVLSDPEVLSTLPPAELRSGLAETIKHGVIADPLLYSQCADGWPQSINDITELISRAIAVKVEIITADPYERGLRQSLNLGHTIGHGVEKASNYQLSHGECVAIGMIAEARLAESINLSEPGLAEKLAADFIKIGLPVKIPADLNRQEIIAATLLDKKRSAKQIHFALPERIGKVHTGLIVEDWEKRIIW
ncbi:MAG: 3-dehydroquinate synthase, partial [Anaerolineaceae bacterium]